MSFKNNLSSSLLKLIEIVLGRERQSQVGRPCGIEAEVFTFPFKAPLVLYPGTGCKLPGNEMGSLEENARAPVLLGQAATACSGGGRGLGRDL